MAMDLNKKLAQLKPQKGAVPVKPGAQPSRGGPEGRIIVKSGAYLTMLMHVLRFASNKMDKSQWVEVMGACEGKLEGNDLVIYEAVPISHGERIEVAWEAADYAMFAELDQKYAEKGLFACSWYHSHPGLKTFLSKIDVKNHLFWQNEANPRGTALVFDHTYLDNEGDLGVRAFRLDDISKGITSDWHEVPLIIEPPDKAKFFKAIRGVVDAAHRKDDLYVKELSETEWADSVDQTPEEGAEQEGAGAIPTISPLQPAIDGFQTGIQAVANTFVKNLTAQLDDWSADVKKAATKGSDPLVEVMSSMQDAVVDGLGRVQSQFETSFNEQVQQLEDSVTEVVKRFEQGPGNLAGALGTFVQDLSKELGAHLQAKFAEKLKEIDQVIASALTKMSGFSNLGSSLTQGLNAQGGKIKTLSTSVADLVTAVTTISQQSQEKIKTTVEDSGRSLHDLLDEIKKEQEKLKGAAKEIEAKIKEIRSVF